MQRLCCWDVVLFSMQDRLLTRQSPPPLHAVTATIFGRMLMTGIIISRVGESVVGLSLRGIILLREILN